MPRKVKIVRIKEPGRHVVMRPGTKIAFVPDPHIPYRDDDELVLAYPWMFEADEDLLLADAVIEEATANPGQARRVGRPPLPRDEHGNIVRD